MRRGERDGRLRWAFGLAVLLHAGALAVLAHLPLAQASSSFDTITVFGAGPAFSGSPVTIVDPPPLGSASSGSAAETAPEPGDNREVAPEPAPKPAMPRPKQQAHQDPVRSHAPEESVEPVAPVKPVPAPPSPVPADPTDPGGEGGEPVTVGPPSPVSAVAAPGGPGGEGEGPTAAPPAGPDDREGTGVPRGGRGGRDGGPDGGPSGTRGPSGTGEQTGESAESAGSANPGLPEVEWANPEVLRTTEPVYPRVAAENRVEGTVVMKVLVGERGEVVEAKVLRSSHDRRLDNAALTAVRQWRYEPATQDGKPRRVYTRATIRFKLP